MIRPLTPLLILLLCLLSSIACRHDREDRTMEAQSRYSELRRAFDADVEAFMVRYRAASEAERARMLDAPQEPRHQYTPLMREEALRFRGLPAAIPFDVWLLKNAGAVDERLTHEAGARLMENDVTSLRMIRAPSALRAATSVRGRETTLRWLQHLAQRSPHDRVRAEAYLQAAILLRESGEQNEAARYVRLAAELAPGTETATRAQRVATSLEAMRVGAAAPPLRGMTVEGDVVDLDAMRGRLVMVDFWGAWCGPCVAKMPARIRLARRFAGSEFEILGVNSDVDPALVAGFIREHRIPWTNVLDGGTRGPIANAWGVTRWPATFLIGRDGTIDAVEPSDTALVDMIERSLQRN